MRSQKYPVWIKNHRTGQYVRIPYDKMIRIDDKWIIPAYQTGEAADFLTRHFKYFEYDPMHTHFIFLGRINKQARWERIINNLGYGVTGAYAVFAASSFYLGEYRVGVILTVGAVVMLGISRRRASGY